MDDTLEAEKTVDPVTPLKVAMMVAVPVPLPAVTRPFDPPVLFTVATAVFVELQVADVLIFAVWLFERVPIADNWMLVPGAMLGFAGVMAIDFTVGA